MEIETLTPIKYKVAHHLGFITLERPQSLNALNLSMITALREILRAWRRDSNVHAVIVQGKGERAFCAGGDLRAVYEAHLRDDHQFHDDLFRKEYTLNLEIAQFPKPYISFIHGFAMGGGLGLSIHGSHRLLAENAQLAMPETKIGYFPDVGASYFLNKAPGALGMYLALTGNSIGTSDSLYVGLATHFIPQKRQAQVIEALLGSETLLPENIDKILERYIENLPESSLQAQQAKIDALFHHLTLEEVFEALKSDQSSFAQDTLKTLKLRSPTSLRITFELLKRNKGKSLSEAIETEFQLSQVFIKKHDFFEGIRALLIDKDQKPIWSPATVEEVDSFVVEEYFNHTVKPLNK
jgi:enoyl-CoA hydratase/carnithine racemase